MPRLFGVLEDLVAADAEAMAIDADAGAKPAAHGCNDGICKDPGADPGGGESPHPIIGAGACPSAEGTEAATPAIRGAGVLGDCKLGANLGDNS